MNAQHADRTDRHQATTRFALVEKAEELFAGHGIDAVSLRQIGAGIGSSNTNVVGYHFGNKAALIAAVFEHRIPDLEVQRAQALTHLDVEELGQDGFGLLTALWLPLFEQTNVAGMHSYGRFLGELVRSGKGGLRRAFDGSFPATSEIGRRLQCLIPPEAQQFAVVRNHVMVMIVAEALRLIDEASDADRHQKLAIFTDALAMALAALTTDQARRT